ncbi:hypothetical protein GCM10009128_06150 [Psychrosphaera haliotis]|uniref:hypothetical protein n=1 Tax=Psychrosphaera haliotis TaxID=555083 RepID=UPI0031D82383
MKKLFILVLAFVITGCASVNLKEARYSTSVKIAEFNSIASQYFEKPTFAKIMRMDTLKGDTIQYIADSYGASCGKYGCSQNNMAFFIHIKDVENVLIAINKYESWNKLATSEGDTINKEILTFDSNFNSSLKYKYSFYSGNRTSHYLVITACGGFGVCVHDSAAYLNADSVKHLKSDLQKFKSGELSKFDIESKYN